MGFDSLHDLPDADALTADVADLAGHPAFNQPDPNAKIDHAAEREKMLAAGYDETRPGVFSKGLGTDLVTTYVSLLPGWE